MKKISLLALLISAFYLQNCINHDSGGVSTSDIVLFSTKTITEADTNDGTFDAVITATLEGTKFSETLTAGTDYGSIDLPKGLTASVERISDTKVKIHFTGQATKHSFCSNGQMSFFFNASAFQNGQLPISFEVPISVQYISPVLTYSGFILDENTNNIGEFPQTITVTTENGGTFSRSSGTLVENTDYFWTNLPAGLTSMITLNSNTSATISFTGAATNNTPDYDAIANLKFSAAALSSEFCAALAKKNVEFDMYRSVIMYAVDAPDGNLRGTELTARLGADGLCLAQAPTLPEDYDGVSAFISINATDEIRDLFADQAGGGDVPFDVMFESANGGKIADDRNDLLNGSIDQSLDVADVTTTNGTHFWTGSTSTGALISGAHTCTGWTNNLTTDGEIGISSSATSTWLDTTAPDACTTTTNKILCIAYVKQ